MANQTSQHILGSAANLLGFCLIVLTSLRISNKAETSLIDEATALISVCLAISSLFSFFSIRTQSPTRTDRLETVADYFYATSLVVILVVILLISINYL